MLSEFPGLMVKPGSYPCMVEHPSGQRLAAELELGAGRSPLGQVFGWPVEERDGIRTWPQPTERYPLLKCDLRAGWEVLLVDATVQARFPEQASLTAALAVAGPTPSLLGVRRSLSCIDPGMPGCDCLGVSLLRRA